MVDATTLSQEASAEFESLIIRDLNNPRIKSVSVQEFSLSTISVGKFDDWKDNPKWFDIWTHSEDSLIEHSCSAFVYHPDLMEVAKRLKKDYPKLKLHSANTKENLPSRVEKTLEEHELPKDLTLSWWVVEALDVAERGLERIGCPFRLSDFVIWSCSETPPHLSNIAEIGEPELFVENPRFGVRFEMTGEIAPTDSKNIWQFKDGRYISTVWEYLGWGDNEKARELRRCLHDIGHGIEESIVSLNPESDKADIERTILKHGSIYRAGMAATKLVVELELRQVAEQGYSKLAAGDKSGDIGGAHSQARKKRNLELLLTEIESFSDIADRLSESVIFEQAVANARKKDPKFPKTAKTIETYGTDLRSFDEFRRRYNAVFGKKA